MYVIIQYAHYDISHFDFLVGGGDGDGDSGVSSAPINMHVSISENTQS